MDYAQKWALVNLVYEFANCTYKNYEYSKTISSAAIPVQSLQKSSHYFVNFNLFNGKEIDKSSTIFIDGLTWLRWSLRSDQLCLLHFTVFLTSTSTAKNTLEKKSEISRVAIVKPLPMLFPGFPMAFVHPIFAFNAFGSSSLGTNAAGERKRGLIQVSLQNAIPIALEGIEIPIAQLIHVKLIADSTEDEQKINSIKIRVEAEKDLEKYFSLPRCLSDGDLFEVKVDGHFPDCSRMRLYQAIFPPEFNKRNNASCRELSSMDKNSMPFLVQYGESTCIEVGEGEEKHQRYPQWSRETDKILETEYHMPERVVMVAEEMADALWPLFSEQHRRNCNNFLHIQLALLQCDLEGTKLVLESFARRVDVQLFVVDILDIWQQSNVGSGGEQNHRMKIEETLKKVERKSPCICWLKNVPILFGNKDGGEGNGEQLESLIDALTVRVRLIFVDLFSCFGPEPKREGNNAINSFPHPILFVFSCTSFERPEIPERLEKLIEWEFTVEDGDDRLSRDERRAYSRYRLAICPVDWKGANLDEQVAEMTKGQSLLQMQRIIDQAEQTAFVESYKNPNIYSAILRIDHFKEVLNRMAPSTGTVSKVGLDEVGGLDKAKFLLKEALGELVKESSTENNLHLKGNTNHLLRQTGILLYGPPGCGKTLLAKAVANEFGLAFFNVKGPELLSQYVGQSEKNMRELFSKARVAAPAVLFFDELDSLAPNRGMKSDSGGVMDRMVSQFLTELDACKWTRRKPVFVMGATNRPDLLDPCLLMPGRFDKLVHIQPASDFESKERILLPLCKHLILESGLTLKDIASKCPELMTGADLAGLVQTAKMLRIRELINSYENNSSSKKLIAKPTEKQIVLSMKYFEQALGMFEGSISEATVKRYKNMNIDDSI